jgi:formate hydrogenlyase transcriptional activator
MTNAHADGQAIATDDRYQALLATSQAIISHRGLSPLFHDLAGQLSRVVHFDFLALVLHEPATSTMRLHVLETCEPVPPGTVIILPVDEDPAGLVWQTQQPLITSHIDELRRWPRLLERVQPYSVESYCWLPLTTARRRLGTLVFTSKQPCAYDAANLPFLQQVANQVAVAVENALVFQELEALNAKLSKEKAYLEEEVRTQHEFGDIVGESISLCDVLKRVETVAATDSTVLVCGETGTGKELIGRAVHELSGRCERTFVKLNCAAIPMGLWKVNCLVTRKAPSLVPSAKRSAGSNWHMKERCFWTKSETSLRNCSQSCFVFCRSKNSNVWVARGRSRWMCGLWRRRTAISARW